MKGTALLVASLALAPATLTAQPPIPGEPLDTVTDVNGSSSNDRIVRSAGVFDVTTARPISSSLTSRVRMTETTWRLDLDSTKRDPAVVDWVGMVCEQARIDATLHFKRLTEPKTHEEVVHHPGFERYIRGLKGYFTTGIRWNDGDDFLTNDISHPLAGAISSHVYTNHDRRCAGMAFGERGYSPCVGRATVFSILASANWEWNPMMSETALGHVGAKYVCAAGRCTGEGGWTDLVMTPLGGAGIRIAGDVARAKLWPVLDRDLSGNLAAKVLKNTVKVLTDPGRVLNCVFNLSFHDALTSTPSGRRR
jgi:hypothetical protein